MSGIGPARKIWETEQCLPIIFTTTEPNFALDSYSVHAIDYLVKPLAADKASWRLREYLSVPALLTLLKPSGQGYVSPVEIPLDDILYGQYGSHIMDVHTTQGVFCTRISFRDFTAELPQTGSLCVWAG